MIKAKLHANHILGLDLPILVPADHFLLYRAPSDLVVFLVVAASAVPARPKARKEHAEGELAVIWFCY